jgi:hypothetical protein
VTGNAVTGRPGERGEEEACERPREGRRRRISCNGDSGRGRVGGTGTAANSESEAAADSGWRPRTPSQWASVHGHPRLASLATGQLGGQ